MNLTPYRKITIIAFVIFLIIAAVFLTYKLITARERFSFRLFDTLTKHSSKLDIIEAVNNLEVRLDALESSMDDLQSFAYDLENQLVDGLNNAIYKAESVESDLFYTQSELSETQNELEELIKDLKWKNVLD
jgi:chromosome segregation ATPase